MENYSVQAILSARDAGFTAGMRAAQASAGRLENKMRSGLGFGVMAGIGMKAFSMVTSGLGGIGQAVDKAVQRVDTLNNFKPVMRNLGYGAKDADKSLKMMLGGLKGLPTSLDQIAGVTTKIAPLTGSLKSATKISLAMNNALLAGGKSAEAQANGLEQYAQMLSAKKVDMQSWRSLLDAMPAQLNQLSIKLLGAGKNQKDLYDALKGGKVTFKDFNNALLELNQKGLKGFGSFKQQAVAATQGIQTGISNIKVAITKGLANSINKADEILKKNGFGGFKANLAKVEEWFNQSFEKLSNSQGFKTFITTFAKSIKFLGQNAGTIAKFIGAFMGLKVIGGIGSHIASVGGQLKILTGLLSGTPATAEAAAAGYAKLSPSLQMVSTVAGKAQSGIGLLATKLGLSKSLMLGTIAPLGLLVAGLGAVGYAVYKSATANSKYLDSVNQVNATSTKRVEAAKKEGEVADFYANQLDKLAGKENKTAAEKERMAFLTEQLNGKVQGLGLAYDKEKDSLNMSTKAIHKKIEAMKLEAMAGANKKGMAEAMEKDLELQTKIADQKKKVAEAQRKLDEHQGPKTLQDAGYQDLVKNLEQAKGALNGMDTAFKTNKANMALWSARMSLSSGNIKSALSQLEKIASEKGYKIPANLAKGISEGNIQIPTSMESWITLIESHGGKAVSKAKEKGKQSGSAFGAGAKESKGNVLLGGVAVASGFVSGLLSKKGSAHSGGYALGSNAKSGAKDGSSGTESLGSSFGSGFYNGIVGWIGRVSCAAQSMASTAYDTMKNFLNINSPSRVIRALGYSVGEGFEVGISAYGGRVGKAGVNLAKSVDRGITTEAEIHSPSKKAKRRGKHIGRGLAIGVKNSAKLVQKASKRLVRGTIFKKMGSVTKRGVLSQNFEKTATDSANLFKKTLEDRVKNATSGVNSAVKRRINTYIDSYGLSKKAKKKIAKLESKKKLSKGQKKQLQKLKQSGKMPKKLRRAYQDLGSAFKSKFSSQIRSQMNKAIDVANSKLTALGKKYQEKYDAIISARNGFVDKMRSYGQLYSTDSYGFTMLTDFKALNKENNVLHSKLKKLQSIIGTSQTSRTFLDQITSMEPSQQISFLNKLLQKSKAGVKQYYNEFNRYWNNASKIGTSVYKPFITGLDMQYNKELKSVMANLSRQFDSIGRQASNGLIKGISGKANQKKLKSAAASLANLIKREVKKALKIHSPSRVMAKLGNYTGEGFALGIEAMSRDVMNAMDRLTQTPTVSTATLAGGFNSELSSDYNYFRQTEYTIVVPVQMNDKEIARVIAPVMEGELGKMQSRANRKRGIK